MRKARAETNFVSRRAGLTIALNFLVYRHLAVFPRILGYWRGGRIKNLSRNSEKCFYTRSVSSLASCGEFSILGKNKH